MKRRSATSSAPPEPVFFSDENLGRFKFPRRLKAAEVPLEIHFDHFPQGAPDAEWLPEVGRRGWVLLTLDARLRYNRLEQNAIIEHRIAAFVLSGGTTHEDKADVFLEARRRIERLLFKQPPPFIAKVYAKGRVELWLTRDQWRKGRRPK